MKPLAILTALLVMLRVSGLAPDLAWGWAFVPILMPFGLVVLFMIIAFVAMLWSAVVTVVGGKT